MTSSHKFPVAELPIGSTYLIVGHLRHPTDKDLIQIFEQFLQGYGQITRSNWYKCDPVTFTLKCATSADAEDLEEELDDKGAPILLSPLSNACCSVCEAHSLCTGSSSLHLTLQFLFLVRQTSLWVACASHVLKMRRG